MAGVENFKMGLNIPKLEGIGNWPEYKKVNKVLGIVDGTRQKPTKSEQADKQANSRIRSYCKMG